MGLHVIEFPESTGARVKSNSQERRLWDGIFIGTVAMTETCALGLLGFLGMGGKEVMAVGFAKVR